MALGWVEILRLHKTLIAVAMASLCLGRGNAQPPSNQLPSGGGVVAGQANLISAPLTPNHLRIEQSSLRSVIDWQSFSVGSQARVEFVQPSSNAATLNRVTGGAPSQIFGQISANGQVFLTNPAGILFGRSASVDVGSLVATTMKMDSQDFMDGRFRFSDGSAAGRIVNEGELRAGIGGYIALLAPEVINQGLVIAQKGTVALASGEAIELIFDQEQLSSLRIDPARVKSLIQNQQAIEAPGGLIILSAAATEELWSSVVHVDGQLNASSMVERGGRIILEANQISLGENSSVLATGALGGGEVYVGGGWQGGPIPSSLRAAESGVAIQSATKVSMKKGALIDASAVTTGDGGTVVLWSDVANPNSLTSVHGSIIAKGADAGKGGRVETSGYQLDISGSVNAGQGGLWLLDPIDISIVNFGSGVSKSSVEDSLNLGNHVAIETTAGAGSGLVTVSANIVKSSGSEATLTIKANGGISFNSGASIQDGSADGGNEPLSVSLRSGGPVVFQGNSAFHEAIAIRGDLLIGGLVGGDSFALGSAATTTGIYLGDFTGLRAGSITMRGQGFSPVLSGAGGRGIEIGSNVKLSASGNIFLDGIGGKGGAGSAGAPGVNANGNFLNKVDPGGPGGNGGVGGTGGDGIRVQSNAVLSGWNLSIKGQGGNGGLGGAGGRGGKGDNDALFQSGPGGTGGRGG